jgi:hypothetical protein
MRGPKESQKDRRVTRRGQEVVRGYEGAKAASFLAVRAAFTLGPLTVALLKGEMSESP